MKTPNLLFMLAMACITAQGAAAADITSKVKVDARPRTVDRETERFGVRQKAALTLSQTTLHAKIENLRFEPLPAAKVEYIIQMNQATGPLAVRPRTVRGEEQIDAIRGRGTLEASFGNIDLRSANFTAREDEITGWKLKFTYGNGDTATFQSPGFREK